MQSRIEGGTRRVTTGNMVAAHFEHLAARPSRTGQRHGVGTDPHMHPHVVIANLTRRDDGAWRGGEILDVYRSQAFATAVYRTTLARTRMIACWRAERSQRWRWSRRNAGP